MVRWLLLISILIGCLSVSWGQCGYKVMFYNVENLFDTADDPQTADEEFLPRGSKRWTKNRYTSKLRALARVVDSLGQGCMPLMVGMAEVENRRVLEDLVYKTKLVDGNYGIVHHDSPDVRGIDVALLYRKDFVTVVEEESLRIDFPEDSDIKTRDILYVKTLVATDTLHVFVCHFPSMRGGEQKSEWKRIRAAEVVRHKTDSLFSTNSNAFVMLMGDLNGRPGTKAQQLLASRKCGGENIPERLYNLGHYLLKKPEGTYRYRGKWQTLDHIFVSGSMLKEEASLRVVGNTVIYSPSFLLEEDTSHFGFRPRPTYRGPRYIGGTSDHLPIYVTLFFSASPDAEDLEQ